MNTHGVQITWLGHATFRLRANGKVFYIDPFLTPNPKCPEAEKKPSIADVILATHGHGDHISDVIELAQRSKAKVISIIELGNWFQRKGLAEDASVAMNMGGTVEAGGAKVTMVPAFHSSSITEDGSCVCVGEPAGFVIRFSGGLSLYHAGDTAVFGDMKLIGELYHPTVAMLPIGDFYTMGPEQAAMACRLLGVKSVIPMHYGTWPILSGTPAELRGFLKGTDIQVVEMQPGQTIG